MRNSRTGYGQPNHTHLDIELLSAYIDGEVTADEASRVESHLQSCSTCFDELESLRWTVNLLHEVPPVAVPRAFVIRPADVEAEPARRRLALPNWIFNTLQWATVTTALLVVAVFAADLLGAGRLGGAASAPAVSREAPAREQAAPMAAPEMRGEEGEEATAGGAPTVKAKREESAEILGARQEQPAPAPTTAPGPATSQQLKSQPESAQPEAQAQAEAEARQATQPQPAEAEQPQQAAAAEPTREPEIAARTLAANQSPNWLRLAEIGLTGLLIVLLVLTLWARRRRAS